MHLDVVKSWNNLAIVTNEWHMKRTKAIFEKVFSLSSLAKPASAYHLEFVPVDDALPPEILSVRQQREAASLKTFMTDTRYQWNSLSDLHHWMFTSHTAYSSIRFTKTFVKESISKDISKTY
jgi:uncharacterized SAM-binding protein YcdF (DUF218 family)